jgi:hypothetical protein
VLRAAQCAEGWHLEAEPIADPPPPDEVQAMWVEHRAAAQAWWDTAQAAGEDTGELDELIAELDQEIATFLGVALVGMLLGMVDDRPGPPPWASARHTCSVRVGLGRR